MSSPAACPKCQSAQVVGAAVHPSKIKELGLPKFTILGYQMCKDCNHIWEKPAPLWAWYIGLVFGACLLIPFVYAVTTANNDPGALGGVGVLAVFGMTAFVGSIRGLARTKRASLGQ